MSYLAILTASLLGSLHCVGMCGGFATLAGAREDGGQGSGPVFAYHGARVAAYILLGAIAGALGAGLDLFGRMAGLQRVAGVAMGASLLVLALHGLWRIRHPLRGDLTQLGGPRPRPRRLDRLRAQLLRASRRGPWIGAAATGALAVFLPCLWLWSYVILAASTGSAARGALAMAAFALGTLPALFALSWISRVVSRRWAQRAPLLSALLLAVLGCASIVGWTGGPVAPPLAPASGEIPREAPCHASGMGAEQP